MKQQPSPASFPTHKLQPVGAGGGLTPAASGDDYDVGFADTSDYHASLPDLMGQPNEDMRQ